MNAIENRFKVAVLLGGGFRVQTTLPEVDDYNFAPRDKIPTLLIDGKDDFIFPGDSSQKPFFSSLGTPAKDKRYVLVEAGHVPPTGLFTKELLDWLDRYLRPVQ